MPLSIIEYSGHYQDIISIIDFYLGLTLYTIKVLHFLYRKYKPLLSDKEHNTVPTNVFVGTNYFL